MRAVLSSIRAHPFRTLGVSLLALVGVGAFMNRDLIGLAVASEEPIDYTLPIVEPLTAADGEVVYRIDAARSQVRIEVDETLAGVDGRVELTTRGIAGDVAVAGSGEPSIRMSDLVVDVHQLRSDNSLRDKALRHEFLESHTNRFVRLEDITVELPDDAGHDRAEGARLDGTLVVKGEQHPVSWDVDARVNGDTLSATATTTVLMSDLGVGPISKVGLVRTSDEVDLTVQIVAVDGREFTPPLGLADEVVEADRSGAAPSFASAVQPILEQNCASCHQPDAIGGSKWSLETAADAVEVADGLAVVTGAGYMPPWPASEVGVPLQHTRGLSDEEIRTIAQWASAGAPLDVESDAAVRPPDEPEVEMPRADKVVRMAEPYTGSADHPDDYRCFVLDPEVTERTFMTGYTFDPDQLEIVHHAIVNLVRADQVPELDELDAADDGPGWSCFAGMGSQLGARVAGWVPGQRPLTLPEGDGVELLPGDVFVAQIHYHYHDLSSEVPDRSGMTLELTPDDGTITPLRSATLIGPVELPCAEGVEGPLCDRDASVADVAERFGPGAAGIANILHRLCGTTPEEVAAQSDGIRGSTTCDFPVRWPGELIGVLGHMHELGSSYRMTLNPDTPEETVLLDIPVWNFGWQLNYQPVEDVPLREGDTIRVTCSWDKGLRHDPVPRHVVFAEGTEDEMCFSTLTIRPEPSDDEAGRAR